MKSTQRPAFGATAATRAATVLLGSFIALAPVAGTADTPLNERLVVSDGSTFTGSLLDINYAEHNLPTILAENPGSRIELTDSSLTAQLLNDGSVDRLTAMGVQALNAGFLSLDGFTLAVSAEGGASASRSIGISVRNVLNRDVNTTNLTANNIHISVSGDSIQAHDGYGVGAVYPGANITLTGGSSITANGAYHLGIFAAAGGTVTSTGTTIETNGQRAVGVYANAANQGGAVINLNGDSITTRGEMAFGMFAMRESGASARNGGHTSTINATDVTVETFDNNSVGVFADRGGNIHLTGGSVTTHGENSAGLVSATVTSDPLMAVPSTLTATATTVTTSGANAFGVGSFYGGDIGLTDVTVNTSGSNAHALLSSQAAHVDGLDAISPSIDPNVIDGTPSKIVGSGVIASSTANNASAALAEYEGRIELTDSHLSGTSTTYQNGVVYARSEGYIKLDGGSVTHSAAGNFGNAVNAEGDGSLIQLQDITVTTNAVGLGNTELAAGAYASQGGRVEIADSTVGTSGDRAIGLRVAHNNSAIVTENTEVTTLGHSAHGVHVFSVPDGSEHNIRAELDGGKVDTSGENAYALYAQNSGSTITSSADLYTTGNAGFGAFAYNGGTIVLNGGTIETHGAIRGTAGTYGLISAGTGSSITAPGNTAGEEPTSGITINTHGNDATAVRADTGGTISLADATIATFGARAHGVQAVDAGSSASIDRSTVAVTSSTSSAAHAADSGSLHIKDSQLSGATSGSARGLVQAGTDATIAISGSTITNTYPSYGNAVYASGGATIDIATSEILNTGNGVGTGSLAAGVYAQNGGRINLAASEVTTTGERAYAIRTAGDGSVINVVDSFISTNGDRSHAVQAYAAANGSESTHISISGGEIYTEGSESWGLYAQNAGASITSSADIETVGATGFGVFALDGGEVTLTGGTIETHGDPANPTGGVGSIALLASGSGSSISATGNTGGSSAITVHTTGSKATAAYADNGGHLNLHDATLRTEGGEAYGIHTISGASAYANNTDITTTGSSSAALRLESAGAITVENSRIQSSSYGVQIGNNDNSNGSVHLNNTRLHAEQAAISVHFGSQNDETVNIDVRGNSEITSTSNTLLNVNRIESSAGSNAQVVNFTVGTPAGFPAGSQHAVLRGDILDTSEYKGANDRLNIHIGADAKVYSDNVLGYNTLNVDGQLNNDRLNNTLSINAGQSVGGSGVITKNVVVNGGSLSTDVRIRGSLDLGESARENVEVGEGDSVTIEAGKQAIITTVSNASVDASQGAAVIASVTGSAVVKTGNWGASIANADSGTINASEGTANITHFEGSATLHTGSGGATVGTLAGGTVSGSNAGESHVTVGELAGGTASTVTLIVDNDGTTTGPPAGNVNLHSGVIGGNGKVNAALHLSNSVFAAGSSVGRLDVEGDLTIDASSSYLWEINDATGTAGTFAAGWDFSQVEGVLEFEANASFVIASLGLDNLTGMAANFDQYSDYSWLVAVATDGINGWENLQLELEDFLNTYNGEFALAMEQNGSGSYELYVTYTGAIPEPATVTLLLSGAALLTAAALRRRKAKMG